MNLTEMFEESRRLVNVFKTEHSRLCSAGRAEEMLALVDSGEKVANKLLASGEKKEAEETAEGCLGYIKTEIEYLSSKKHGREFDDLAERSLIGYGTREP